MVFHNRNAELIRHLLPDGERIDFYFDTRSEKSAITKGWEAFVSRRPDAFRQFCGATPRFEDDKDFLPLQAADFWAWWIRKWQKMVLRKTALHAISAFAAPLRTSIVNWKFRQAKIKLSI
jgi:hypothetical protein